MSRHGMFTLLAVVLSAAPASTSLAQCAVGAGPCDKPHAGPGCGEVACCEAVCAFDPVCCESEWDEICVEEAAELCADIPCPMEGSCFEAHEGAGCDIEDCCFFTCVFDSFCCNANWDWICAEEAGRLCGARACTVAVPPGAIPEEELCGEHLNDGCSLSGTLSVPIDCGTVIDGTIGTGSPRDTDWYAITLDAAGRVLWTVEAECPVQLLVLGGTCEGVLQLEAEAYGGPCEAAAIDICLEAGTWFLVVGPGYPERNLSRGVPCPDEDPKTEPGFFGNRYVAAYQCASLASPADLNGDGVVDGADLGLLLSNWGRSGIGDLTGDGVVNGADLGLLLADWS